MTDTHTTPTAARIAGSLSEQERAALELAANGNENIDFVVWQELQIKGLIDYDVESDTDFPTPKGKQVVAALVPVSAEPTDEVLREALQFYANTDNWHLTWNPERDQPINVIDEDGGKLAASVLAAGQPDSGGGVIDPVEAMRLRAEDAIAARLKVESELTRLCGLCGRAANAIDLVGYADPARIRAIQDDLRQAAKDTP